MRMVRALVRPFKLDAVRAALIGAGFQGMTVIEAVTFGGATGEQGVDPAAECDAQLVPMYEVEVAVSDESVDAVVRAISGVGISDVNGDGKIFVSSIDQAIRIRTGETGADAL
jgi:nitrogen regulatory protein PII